MPLMPLGGLDTERVSVQYLFPYKLYGLMNFLNCLKKNILLLYFLQVICDLIKDSLSTNWEHTEEIKSLREMENQGLLSC